MPRGLQTQVLIMDGHGPFIFVQISILGCCSQSSNASYVIDNIRSIASANGNGVGPNSIEVCAYAGFSRDQQNHKIDVISHGSTMAIDCKVVSVGPSSEPWQFPPCESCRTWVEVKQIQCPGCVYDTTRNLCHGCESGSLRVDGFISIRACCTGRTSNSYPIAGVTNPS